MKAVSSEGRRTAPRLFLAALLGAIAMSSSTAMANPKYAAIVVDGKTGHVLHQKNADAHRFPASLTKVMTLYVLFDYLTANRLDYNTKFYVTPHASKRPPSKLGLKASSYVAVKDLIGALVTKSANDAAAVVAENLAGTEENFARVMTKKARAIGMSRTTFKNASGLPNGQQKTTARDMAVLSMRILAEYPQYAKFFKKRSFRYGKRKYGNHNRLLSRYRGTEGIKTGYTRASGFNLTVSVKRDGKHMIAVVMGGRSGRARDNEMIRLLNKSLKKASTKRGSDPASIRIARLSKVGGTRRGAAKKTLEPQNLSAIGRRATSDEKKSDYSAPAANPGAFDLQVGAYDNEARAIQELELAKQRGGAALARYKAFTMRAVVKGRTYHRARFSGFQDRTEADSLCAVLKRQSLRCYVQKVN